MEKKILTALVVVGIGMLAGFIPKQEVSNVKAQHMVVAGDTVWNLAERNFHKQNKYKDVGEFTYYIRKHNNLLGNKPLVVGRVIEIPLIVEK